MDDPFDWELGYENLSGGATRSKATTTTPNLATNGTNALGLITGNISTRLRSHTTAVRDRAPNEDNKNRLEAFFYLPFVNDKISFYLQRITKLLSFVNSFKKKFFNIKF